MIFGISEKCYAQIGFGGVGLPNDYYYSAFPQFYTADYRNAGRAFERSASTAYRVGDKRFVDSVCYWTMAGECYYHLGNYQEALKYYDEALKLYVQQLSEDWQSRVDMPAQILARQNVVQQTNITWGTPTRQGVVANIPDTMTTLFGRLDANRAFIEGGLVDTPEQRGVNVKEIMRCTALALHRRRNILGATAKYDAISSSLVTSLATARGAGPLFRVWNRVLLGIAQATMEDYDIARRTLVDSLQFNNGMDHNLTPVALASLAQIAFVTGDRTTAGQLALEASYSAAMHQQYDLVEESLSLATTIHLMSNKAPFPPLPLAIQWAASERANLLNASLIERLATCHIEAGDTESANRVLQEVNKPMRGSDLSRAVVNSRLRFATAQLAFLRGDVNSGQSELNAAIADFQLGSRWLYQLARADQLVLSGDITGRRADQLYSALLRDPTSAEWMIEPFECLAFLKTPHVAAMERWFETKLLNKQYDQAIEVAELVRRHRFFENLPMGGRLLAFRWMLEGPAEALTNEIQTQRNNFMNQCPQYAELSDRAKDIRGQLLALPLKPDEDSDDLKKQTELFVELANISKSQESLIAAYAVRRQPADIAFPPQGDLSAYFDQIQPGQLAYVTLSTRNGMHVFFVAKNQFKFMGTIPHRELDSNVRKLLKEIGLQDVSGGVDVDILTDETWKLDAHQLARNIFVDSPDFDWDLYKELIVVPDGPLWYVPFEILQLNAAAPPAPANPAAGALDPAGVGDPADPADPDADDAADKDKKPKKTPRQKKVDVNPSDLQMLADNVRIRYSPTLFLAFGEQRPVRTLARTATLTGRMHPKGEVEVTREAITKIQADIPGAADFEEKMSIPTSFYGAILDRMIVCNDIKWPSKGGVFALDLGQIDKGLNGTNLASWLSLPFWGPEHVVLPGFSSGGAAGGRGKGDGQDLFLTACGVLGSGTRAIMLSRWRVGGQNSLDLTRLYAKNLTTMTPALALEQSIKESRQLDLDFDVEPRIKSNKIPAPIKATHPFFWAGHMVVEIPNRATNVEPNSVDAQNLNPADAPGDAVDPVQPDQPPADMKPDEVNPDAIPDPNLPDKPADKDGNVIKDKKKEGDKEDGTDK